VRTKKGNAVLIQRQELVVVSPQLANGFFACCEKPGKTN
jgi:hypothetical protein